LLNLALLRAAGKKQNNLPACNLLYDISAKTSGSDLLK
jgi:hypothetical protein